MSSNIQFKTQLDRAKTSTTPIFNLSEVARNIYNSIRSLGPETVRYWVKELRGIHEQLDEYLEGQFLGADFSDIVGEHIILAQPTTNNVDVKYYFKDESYKQPYPVRFTIRNKVPDGMLKMVEDASVALNKKYGETLSIFYRDQNKDNWEIVHSLAHETYNAPDVYGLNLKIELQPILLEELTNTLKEREKLSDIRLPLKESILIEPEYIKQDVEGKSIVTDQYFNKIVIAPTEVEREALEPKEIE